MNMKKYAVILFSICAFLGTIGCDDSYEFTDEEGLNDPINDFIWQGLNSWYNWQEESADS